MQAAGWGKPSLGGADVPPGVMQIPAQVPQYGQKHVAAAGREGRALRTAGRGTAARCYH